MPEYNLTIFRGGLSLQAGNSAAFVAAVTHWVVVRKRDHLPPPCALSAALG